MEKTCRKSLLSSLIHPRARSSKDFQLDICSNISTETIRLEDAVGRKIVYVGDDREVAKASPPLDFHLDMARVATMNSKRR